MSITDFLLARIAEDEALSRASSPGPWSVDDDGAAVLAVDDIEVCDGFALSGPQTRATTAHIARHNPARVLAECKAKRVAIDYYLNDDETVMAATIKALAAAYADHPDYNSQWQPA